MRIISNLFFYVLVIGCIFLFPAFCIVDNVEEKEKRKSYFNKWVNTASYCLLTIDKIVVNRKLKVVSMIVDLGNFDGQC